MTIEDIVKFVGVVGRYVTDLQKTFPQESQTETIPNDSNVTQDDEVEVVESN
jgi:hypothetical protein